MHKKINKNIYSSSNRVTKRHRIRENRHRKVELRISDVMSSSGVKNAKIKQQQYVKPMKLLSFKSYTDSKKYIDLEFYEEHLILSMNYKTINKLMETPENDFDCPTDDDTIEETVYRKHCELKSYMNLEMNKTTK